MMFTSRVLFPLNVPPSVVLVEEFAEGGDLLAMMMRHGGRLTELVAVNDVLRPLLTVLAHLHVQVGIVDNEIVMMDALQSRSCRLVLTTTTVHRLCVACVVLLLW
jgi:hypothetical protein